jgi:hypothetical protein
MTVSETLAALKTKKGIVPSADYTGTEKADDFIFAIQTDASAQTRRAIGSCLQSVSRSTPVP